APQGSAKGFVVPGKNGAKPRAIVTAANPKTKPWRSVVALTAELAKERAGLSEHAAIHRQYPVVVRVDFWMPRPTTAKKGPISATKKPDLDKLARSILDALTGVAFEDDSQVTALFVTKRLCGVSDLGADQRSPGAYIEIGIDAAGATSLAKSRPSRLSPAEWAALEF
ncbi:MAG: RusA family crossover junction endodeoxyribonuclease, partial [Giesbergeria sp.]